MNLRPAALLVGGALAAVILAVPLPRPSPAWGGDPLPSDAPDLVRALAGDDERARWAASVRLVELGEPVLPALLRAVEGDDARVREAVAAVFLGMAQEGVLAGNEAVARALAALYRAEGQAGETAGKALEELAKTGGRHAVLPLIGLLRDADPHADRELRALLRRLLAAAVGRDLGGDAANWEGWWAGEERRYLERERVRPLPAPSEEQVERATQTALTGSGERVRIVRSELSRTRQGPPVPRGGRWLAEMAFDIDTRVWPWGVYPARVWLLQGKGKSPARLLPTLDLKQEGDSLHSLAVAPATLDPFERTALVVQMVDARDGGSFLLALANARFRDAR